MSNLEEIHACPAKTCDLCGTTGEFLYRGLRDRLFSAPGEWNYRRCPNVDCGLMWLDPMPMEEDLFLAYRDYYTHRSEPAKVEARRCLDNFFRQARAGYLSRTYGYLNLSESWWARLLGFLMYLRPGQRADLDFSVMYLPGSPGGRLLEVGFGGGDLILRLKNLGWSVEGVDVDPEAVRLAKGKGLAVRLGTLTGQSYPSNHFDAIVMSHLIEHVSDPVDLVRECHRILKADGRLVAVTPNSQSWTHQMFKESYMYLDPPRHLHIFNIRSLTALMRMAGLRNPWVTTTIRGANEVFTGSRSIQRSGRYTFISSGSRTYPLWVRAMQLVEWALLKIRPCVGEEICWIGQK